MAKVICSQEDAFDRAVQAIENRFGVSFWDYIGQNGQRSEQVQQKIERALREETLKE